ncbi:MAG: tetratricopeptide repeat protein [Deltaproteobacteria bacterium]|nr:MAG: tetratricopeptide repeat protein [Deltaproteobacteria bacterium]
MKKIIILGAAYILALGGWAFAYKASVAVIPFENLSKVSEIEWIGSGIAETMTTDLKKVKDLKVIERAQLKKVMEELKIKLLTETDTKNAAEAGKLAGADQVVIGGFQRSGTKLRITARLVDVNSTEVLKSFKVTGDYGNLFELQDQIVAKILESFGIPMEEKIKKEIEKAETKSLKAYEHYIRGRDYYLFFSADNYELALEEFKKALEIDNGYALAWSGMSQVYSTWGYHKQQRGEDYKSMYEQSLKAGKKAVDLDPALGDTHRALAQSQLMLEDFSKAAKEAQKAIDLNPNDAEAWEILAHANPKGDPDWAIEKFNRALELNPKLFSAHNDLGEVYFEQKNYEKAIENFREAIKLIPGSINAHNNLGLAYKNKGDLEKAVREFNAALELDPDSVAVHFNLARTYQEQGAGQEALKEFQKVLELKPDHPQAETIKEIIKLLSSE